jgi:hypothetical protein
VARLIERYGADFGLPDWIDELTTSGQWLADGRPSQMIT